MVFASSNLHASNRQDSLYAAFLHSIKHQAFILIFRTDRTVVKYLSVTMSSTKTITHSASGASVTIHEFGATITSFKTGAGRECMFVSRAAKLDGTKAIRGGIPLVFPQFGQPDKSMPQHGFLRNNVWQVDEASAYDRQDSAGISYSLTLKNVKNSRGGKWDESTELDCICVYSIKVEASKMTTTLGIKNTSSLAFDFQTLLHTYYLVEGNAALDASQCYVTGLEGYAAHDKITGEQYKQDGSPVTIDKLTDHVYTPPSGKDVVDVIIGVGAGKTIKMTATGLVDDGMVPVSCVVWNPFKENAAAMGDFGDDQVSLCSH
jgi:glucose-6-phosphate 1-epimerase